MVVCVVEQFEPLIREIYVLVQEYEKLLDIGNLSTTGKVRSRVIILVSPKTL